MAVLRHDVIGLRTESDVVQARQTVRRWAVEMGFSLVEQTKIVTAASELARNTVLYGGGGDLRLEVVGDGARTGLRLTFADQGPGIADIDRALQDGYTTGSGLGLGLGGAKRLMGDLAIRSAPGQGTTIVTTRWK